MGDGRWEMGDGSWELGVGSCDWWLSLRHLVLVSRDREDLLQISENHSIIFSRVAREALQSTWINNY
jgi:hypothetical protein